MNVVVTEQLARTHIDQRLREARRLHPVQNPRPAGRILRRTTH